MNIMNETINPTSHSLLATFFEMNFEVCRKKESSCLRTLVRPKWTSSQLLRLLFPFPLLMSTKRESCWRERRGESVGGPEAPNEVSGVRKTEAGTESNVDDEVEDVGIVGGVDEVAVSGYESEGVTLSEILLRMRLAKKNVSEGVVDTAQVPQCEFPNLQHTPLALLLEFLCWPVIEFY